MKVYFFFTLQRYTSSNGRGIFAPLFIHQKTLRHFLSQIFVFSDYKMTILLLNVTNDVINVVAINTTRHNDVIAMLALARRK